MSQWKPKGAVFQRGHDASSSPWPGKYEDLSNELMLRTEAGAVLLLVLDGPNGSGFTAAFREGTGLSNEHVPMLLRRMADQMVRERGQS